jgi:hypothetical protein
MDRKTTFQRKIFSANEKEVLNVLSHISEKGYPEIVTDLITLYSKTNSLLIKEQTIFILNNLKNKNSAEHFMKGLQSVKNNEIKNHLISACWQNGLDFSPYLSYFTDIIANDDINNAIEAFSVIENNISLLSEKQIKTLKSHLIKTRKNKVINNVRLFEEIEKLLQ